MAKTAIGKYLDPISIYDSAPRLWDFVLLTVLLFYVIKKAFITARALREHAMGGAGKGILDKIASGFGSEKKAREADNMLSFILALIMALGLMRYGNASLKFVFTIGILPGFAAFILGMGIYGLMAGILGPERKGIAFGIAAFAGIGIFMAMRTAADFELMYILFWFLAIIVLVSIMKGFESKAEDPNKALDEISKDVGDAITAGGNVIKKMTGIGKKEEEVVAGHKDLIDTNTDLKGLIEQLMGLLRNAAAAGALVAGASPMAAALPPDVTSKPAIIQELKKAGVDTETAVAVAEQMVVAPTEPPAEIKFEALPPEEVVRSIDGVLKEISAEFDARNAMPNRAFGPVGAEVRKAAEISIRNYVEGHTPKLDSKKLIEALSKQGASKKDVAAFVEFVNEKSDEARNIVHGKVKPAAPPRAPAKVAPTPGKAAPPKKIQEQVKAGIKIALDKLDNAERKFIHQLDLLKDVGQLLSQIPPDVDKLFAQNRKVKYDLSQMHGAAFKLHETTKKPKFQGFEGEAQALVNEIVRLVGTYDDANNTFQKGCEPLSSILSTDTQRLKKDIEEYNAGVGGLKELIAGLRTLNEAVKKAGGVVSNDTLNKHSETVSRIHTRIEKNEVMLKEHGSPEELFVGLSGFFSILKNYPNVLVTVAEEIKTLQGRWSMINDQMAKVEKEEKIEAEAKVKKEEASKRALIDMDGLVDQIGLLESFVEQVAQVKFSSLKKPVSILTKSQIGILRDAADNANRIIIGLKNERVRVNDIPTKTAAMNKLLQTLANFTESDFSKSVIKVSKTLSSAAGMGEERGNPLAGPVLAEFQQKNYPPVLEGVRLTLAAIKDELNKEAKPA